MVLHFVILYVPFLQNLFSIEPLNQTEWMAVLYISAPVILIDEVLKFLERAIYVQPAELPDVQTGIRIGDAKDDAHVANGKVKAH